MAKFVCDSCGDRALFGKLNDGVFFCEDCSDNWDKEDASSDTSSLQDENPEMFGYMNNVNPYGMEGGY